MLTTASMIRIGKSYQELDGRRKSDQWEVVTRAAVSLFKQQNAIKHWHYRRWKPPIMT